MRVTLRPLPEWPHGATQPRRDAQFRSPSKRDPHSGEWTPGRRIGYDQMLSELIYEVDWLGADEIVIGVGLS